MHLFSEQNHSKTELARKKNKMRGLCAQGLGTSLYVGHSGGGMGVCSIQETLAPSLAPPHVLFTAQTYTEAKGTQPRLPCAHHQLPPADLYTSSQIMLKQFPHIM